MPCLSYTLHCTPYTENKKYFLCFFLYLPKGIYLCLFTTLPPACVPYLYTREAYTPSGIYTPSGYTREAYTPSGI